MGRMKHVHIDGDTITMLYGFKTFDPSYEPEDFTVLFLVEREDSFDLWECDLIRPRQLRDRDLVNEVKHILLNYYADIDEPQIGKIFVAAIKELT